MQEGYKRVEIGVIPEDWDLTHIGDIAEFQGGSQPDIKYFSNQEREDRIRLIQIRDYKTEKYITYIPLRLAKRFCSKDDIMIGRYGPPIFQILRGLEGAYNVALIKTIPKGVCKEFLYYVLKDQKLFEYIELLSRRSSGQTGVDLEGLRNYKIPCPAIDEQERIADALSDVDSMTSALEKLIAKKKAVKQGAMQELLTGKKRLHGFSGEWNYIAIGEMTEVFSGGTPNTSIDGYWGGTIPWMNSGELNLKIVRKVTGRITEDGLKNSSTHFIPPFCVLIGLAGQGKTRGTAAYNTFSLCTNQSIAAIYPNDDKFNSKYLYYVMDTQYDNLRELSSGDGGRGGLTKKLLQDYVVYIPRNVEEQNAIASTLSDMDNEIEVLEQKLAKIRQIKQGMMQQLLTGKIRLV